MIALMHQGRINQAIFGDDSSIITQFNNNSTTENILILIKYYQH